MRSLSDRLAFAGIDLPAFTTSPPATAAATALLGAFVGVALVVKPILIVGLLALVLGLIGIAIAIARPGLAFGGLTALLVLIPSYAVPEKGPILLLPAVLGSWGIAIALLWRNAITEGKLFRPNYVDLAAFAFFALMAVSTSFSARADFHDYVHDMFLWIGPYLGARLLLADVESPVRVVATAFAAVAAILAPIALAEYAGSSNPFYHLNFNSGEFAIWASQIARFGSVRAATSFGHPIAFSMFMAASALLSIAMGIVSEKSGERFGWYGMAVLAIGGMALTLSRTGWVMIAVGIVLFTAVALRGEIRKRLLTLFAVIVGALLLTAVAMPSQLEVLPGFGHAQESTYQTSGLYREALLHRALEPGVLHLWGNTYNQVTPTVQFGTATDNAYIILADMWGLIPTFALFGVGAALLLAVARSYGQLDEPVAILPIVAFTGLVGIFFVALITQQQAMVWLLVGAGATAAEMVGASRERTLRDQRRISVRDLR